MGSILTVVVTISTSVWRPPSVATLPPVAKSVSSPPEEPVVSLAPRTREPTSRARHEDSLASLLRWSTTPDTLTSRTSKNEDEKRKDRNVSEISVLLIQKNIFTRRSLKATILHFLKKKQIT